MLLSFATTNGAIWTESQPGDPLAREPVLARCVLRTFSLIRLTTLATLFPPEELPVRLAHRVKELDELPHNLSAMPSINKVKDWYAQSFEVPHFVPRPCSGLKIRRHSIQELISFPTVKTSKDVQTALKLTSTASRVLPESVPNPSFNGGLGNPGSGKMRIPIEKR